MCMTVVNSSNDDNEVSIASIFICVILFKNQKQEQ